MAKNKVQCPYGHFYNTDKFAECPICNPSLVAAVRTETTPNQTIPKVTTASQSQFSRTSSYSPTESVFGSRNEGRRAAQIDKTESVYQALAPVASSLQDAVNAVVSHQDIDDVKTVAMWSAPSGAEPVVGWLVCLKGQYFGQSFNLKAGNNTIGRAMNMDIPLAQEPSVSRNKHCVVTFEPQSQTFYIQQGESSGLTYLNSAMVMAPTPMKAHDRIKLNQAEFFLVPFCTDKFRWEDRLNEH